VTVDEIAHRLVPCGFLQERRGYAQYGDMLCIDNIAS
jgi:hypothetical protein